MTARELLRAVADEYADCDQLTDLCPHESPEHRARAAALRALADRLDAFEDTADMCDSVGDFGGALGKEFAKLDADLSPAPTR